jgi:Fe2+ transport system protein FeoA
VLSFFTRNKPSRSRQLAVIDEPARVAGTDGVAHEASPAAAPAARSCLLAACSAGSRATVLEMRCGENEACRLRALGICEGASVNVVDARHAMLLDVRGTRIALGRALTAGITVQPQSS